MTVSRKSFLFIAALVMIGTAGGVFLLVALGRLRPSNPQENAPAIPPPSNSASTSLAPQAEKSRVGPGTDVWRSPGRRWRLRVKTYSKPHLAQSAIPKLKDEAEEKPVVQEDFAMVVRVLPLRHRGDHDIARFQFIPGEKASKEYLALLRGAKYVLDVDVQTGQVVELHPEYPLPFSVKKFGEQKYTLRGNNWLINECLEIER